MEDRARHLTVRDSMIIGSSSMGLFIALLAVCILIDGSWTPVEAVCRLGISESGLVRNLFTIDCVISGIGMIVCGYSIMRKESRPLVTAGYVLVMVAGMFLIPIGIFDMNTWVHEPFAIGVAFVIGIAITMLTLDDLRCGRHLWIAFTASVSIILAFLIKIWPMFDQFISLMTMTLWTLVRFINGASSGKV